MSALGLLGHGAYGYNGWWDRMEFLRWTSGRRHELSLLAECILSTSPESAPVFPQTLQELFDTGCIRPDEMESFDSAGHVRIIRGFRPVAPPAADNPITMIERYEPPGDSVQVLYRHGHVNHSHRTKEESVASERRAERECALRAFIRLRGTRRRPISFAYDSEGLIGRSLSCRPRAELPGTPRHRSIQDSSA